MLTETEEWGETRRREETGQRLNGVTSEQERWDAGIRAGGGHFLQSWRWAAFKERHGWLGERVAVSAPSGTAQALILFRQRGPVSVGYVPRGPVIAGGEDVAAALWQEIDRRARQYRALTVLVEPDQWLPLTGSYRAWGFVRGTRHVQPSRTVKVPLIDDDALLAQMHQKTRYSIRLAHRRGVAIERPVVDDVVLGTFYNVLRETSERNAFGIHDRSYYADFMTIFGDDALLLFAKNGDAVASVLVAVKFGTEAIYMYGASSTKHRAHGASFALQFAAMQWAREHGCRSYDLWGIPAQDPESTQAEGNRVAGTHGDDWRGLYKFKVGFGGEIVSLPPTLERRYHPYLAYLARRYTLAGGA